MLKSILKLDGVKELSKNEQRNTKGGTCYPGQTPIDCDCPYYASAGGLYPPGSTVYNNRLAYCTGQQNNCVCL